MLFTVITVSFRAGDKLKNTVLDTLMQEYTDYELLVKDSVSDDGSVEELKTRLLDLGFSEKTASEVFPGDSAEGLCYVKDNAPKVRLVSAKDKGIYDGMNEAVAAALGDYVIFMNCGDTFYDTTVLKKTAEVIQTEPDRGIYYGDAYFCKADEVIVQPDEITESVCYRHVPNHQACFFDRHLWDGEGFRLKYRIRADYEFFLRAFFEKGIRPFHLPFTVSSYEGGGYSETEENKKKDREEHREITEMYMGKKRAAHYRRVMVFTLQPLRSRLAESPAFSGAYQSLRKKILHGRKG